MVNERVFDPPASPCHDAIPFPMPRQCHTRRDAAGLALRGSNPYAAADTARAPETARPTLSDARNGTGDTANNGNVQVGAETTTQRDQKRTGGRAAKKRAQRRATAEQAGTAAAAEQADGSTGGATEQVGTQQKTQPDRALISQLARKLQDETAQISQLDDYVKSLANEVALLRSGQPRRGAADSVVAVEQHQAMVDSLARQEQQIAALADLVHSQAVTIADQQQQLRSGEKRLLEQERVNQLFRSEVQQLQQLVRPSGASACEKPAVNAVQHQAVVEQLDEWVANSRGQTLQGWVRMDMMDDNLEQVQEQIDWMEQATKDGFRDLAGEVIERLQQIDERLQDLEKQAVPVVWPEYEKIGELLKAEGKVDSPDVRLGILNGKARLDSVQRRR